MRFIPWGTDHFPNDLCIDYKYLMAVSGKLETTKGCSIKFGFIVVLSIHGLAVYEQRGKCDDRACLGGSTVQMIGRSIRSTFLCLQRAYKLNSNG